MKEKKGSGAFFCDGRSSSTGVSFYKHTLANAHVNTNMQRLTNSTTCTFFTPRPRRSRARLVLESQWPGGVCSHPSWEPEKTQSNALGVQEHLSLMTGHSLLITYSSVPARLIITALNKDVMKMPLCFSAPLRVQLSALDQRPQPLLQVYVRQDFHGPAFKVTRINARK